MLARDSAYQFGRFRLDPAERRLVRDDGRALSLPPKMFDTLCLLLDRPGQALSKSELLEAVWPDTAVEESNLTVTISALRKALGCCEADRYIETVTRFGYRFAAQVAEVPRAAGPAAAAPAGESRIDSLAILPFTCLGGDDSLPLGLGLADALITRLGGLGHLSVRPTNAVSRIRRADADALTVARLLRVDALLDGTIQHAGGRTRVRAQLIDGRLGRTRWAGTFDEHTVDVLWLQESIAQQIAAVLLPELTDADRARVVRRYTDDREAFQRYMQGRDQWSRWTPPSLCEAIRHFEEAIARDPGFALAHAGMADVYAILGFQGAVAPAAAWPRARAAALRAIELDPSLAEAHVALATARFLYDWDWRSAEAGYRQALALNSTCAVAWHQYATYLFALGRFGAAAAAITQAEELDPLSPIVKTMAAFRFFLARDRENDLRACRRIVALYPDYAVGHVALALACESLRDHDAAVAAITTARALADGSVMTTALLARAYALAGRTAEAGAILGDLAGRGEREYVPAYLVGLAYLALDRRDQAFEHLERAHEQHDGWLVWINVDPRLDPLEGDPRLGRLRERIGLPTT
jgi:DNA-binding winged helix-turn-helix (wHTH) protein/tetratricopeptide (TPR) repeat protein